MSIQDPPPQQFAPFRVWHDEDQRIAAQNVINLPEEHRRAVAEELLSRARNYCPEQFSSRNFKIRLLSPAFVVGFIAVIASVVTFPAYALTIVLSWVLLMNVAVTILRFAAIVASKTRKNIPSFLVKTPSANTKHSPKVSLLIPLFHEAKVLPSLIENLKSLNYPSESLEILLLLEEVDTITSGFLAEIDLPPFINVLTIPEDWLQTKPKAMNYALPHCTGDIVGVYDAEDRPESDQIWKIANHFMTAPANVACVQGNLDFYNSRDNWMARCFTIDYAMWFQVLLRGVQTLGIPIPLGGTTVFFRRHVLIEIGGWDAYNVTEDAELGMRLARFGYRCEMVDTTTWEEANCAPISWIRQRSRWLKGYAMTWTSHMRAPVVLWRELGPLGFVGFQVILLSGLTSNLATPLFVALWASYLGFDLLPIDAIPAPFWTVFIGVMILGEIAVLAIATMSVWAAEKRHLLPYILTLPFYWSLGAIASYKAIIELVFAPFYWDKTSHGHTSPDQTPPASDFNRIS